jgi:tetratricopeptide (TPR) repeat protein
MRFRRLRSALAPVLLAGGLLAGPACAEGTGNPGAYLAAGVAAAEGDFTAAARWYELALKDDPANPRLLDGAVIANLALGRMDAAATVAGAQNPPGQAGYLALVDDASRRGDFARVLELTKANPNGGALLDGLIIAWSELGQGRMSQALDGFDKLAKTKGFEAFGLYHKALALASAGDYEGADDILSGRAAGPIGVMRRGVIAHAQILSQLEKNADAVALLDRSFGTDPDPQIDDLRRRLTAGEPVPFDIVRNATDGMGEVFFTLATALNGQADDAYTLLYARIAADLRPDHTDALLLAAGLLEQLGQHDLATEVYARIPTDSPIFHVAEMGRAEAAYNAGRKDAAIEILQGLVRSHPDILAIRTALGDTLRREERYAEACEAYDAAIGLIGIRPDPMHWAIYFSRGICEERMGEYDKAEADMRQSLTLNPDQPQVLNYLGYSFVERRVNLDEALDMIQRAVAARPDSGYIVDSLAWAYFQLGRYQDAVAPMEKASLLEPVDPVVTDHLGDVYWMAGRRREAEFQWHRALSFSPTETDAARIRLKLEKGLDAVLADEAARPGAAKALTDGN